MKTAAEQLARYKSVHLNPTNIKTHFVGIPLIIWSAFVWLGLIRFELGTLGEASAAMVFTLIVLAYYLKLHVRLAVGMLVFILPVLYTSDMMASVPHVAWIAAVVFIIGWVFQLIGHKYEKAKPAFVDDMNQLLIGPFFLMAEVYFALGLEKALEREITPQAIALRRALEAGRKTA
ncbi:DUF962 domain-containing protein [Shewanella sp. FJAT-52076]|uniref:Mpo1 family 2-hydroxy fatty acid dioxygenase n=1 Tax=Shewanella sp. FJAT-52076 TaxID=2864202 RepID=UPI001C660638|nr:Mpo1-like protein [Shewanella sp. FJAT-52076]QYJ76246.1 DUF962 domain-containing protein [Shewanella sp. FJAT-52076]